MISMGNFVKQLEVCDKRWGAKDPNAARVIPALMDLFIEMEANMKNMHCVMQAQSNYLGRGVNVPADTWDVRFSLDRALYREPVVDRT